MAEHTSMLTTAEGAAQVRISSIESCAEALRGRTAHNEQQNPILMMPTDDVTLARTHTRCRCQTLLHTAQTLPIQLSLGSLEQQPQSDLCWAPPCHLPGCPAESLLQQYMGTHAPLLLTAAAMTTPANMSSSMTTNFIMLAWRGAFAFTVVISMPAKIALCLTIYLYNCTHGPKALQNHITTM